MAISKHSITINYHETTTSVTPDPEPEPTPESDTSSGKLITLGNLATFKEEMDTLLAEKMANPIITAPSSANTTGAIQIVILSSEPAQRYDGYIYIITGSN